MLSSTRCRRKRITRRMDEGETRYTSAVGQALCSIASGIALQHVTRSKPSTEYPIWAFGSAFGCSLLGALSYGIPQLDEYRPLHRRASFLMHCVFVPLMSMHFASANSYDKDLSYLLLVFPVFPIVANLIDDRNQYSLQDMVVGGSLAFKAYMHFQSQNHYGLAFCVSYALAHYIVGSDGTIADLPALDLHSVCFMFNMFFLIKALY